MKIFTLVFGFIISTALISFLVYDLVARGSYTDKAELVLITDKIYNVFCHKRTLSYFTFINVKNYSPLVLGHKPCNWAKKEFPKNKEITFLASDDDSYIYELWDDEKKYFTYEEAVKDYREMKTTGRILLWFVAILIPVMVIINFRRNNQTRKPTRTI